MKPGSAVAKDINDLNDPRVEDEI
jgi:hypothetical protein